MAEQQKFSNQNEQDKTQEVLDRITRHQKAGRAKEALKLVEDLLAERGPMPRLLHIKGLTLMMLDRAEEGESLIRQGLEGAPEDPLQMVDLGVLLAESNRLDEAIELFQTAVELAPNFEMAHSNLGAGLVIKQDYQGAIKHLSRAIELEGTLLDAHVNLGVAYTAVNRFGEAVDVLYKALALDPLNLATHIRLSGALYRLERPESAEHHARKALEIAPDANEAMLHLGNALASMGKMDAAVEALLQAAGKRPLGHMALARLIQLRKTQSDAPELALLDGYLDRAESFPPEARSTICFAAGKANDDLGHYEAAFGHYQRGNALSRELHPYDRDEARARAERVRAFCSPELIRRCGSAGITDIAPIFISGMPRSGTTLMDQMFSRHPEVTAGGELRALPIAMQESRIHAALEERVPEDEIVPDDFNIVGERYMDAVRAEGIRSEYMSDKMPSNFLYSGIVSLALPRAKVILMRRHPLDCLLSNYFQNFGQNQPFSCDFEDLAAAYRSFDDQVRHWQALIPERVRVVNYEDMTAEPEAQMKSLLGWIGLDWDPQVLNFEGSSRQVLTASIAQVREPIYTRSVARWKHYAPHLEGLARLLSDYLTREELDLCGVG